MAPIKITPWRWPHEWSKHVTVIRKCVLYFHAFTFIGCSWYHISYLSTPLLIIENWIELLFQHIISYISENVLRLLFYVLLTVHLSIFIAVFNQMDAQNLFYNKFYFMHLHVSSTYAHHQEVKIALHSP